MDDKVDYVKLEALYRLYYMFYNDYTETDIKKNNSRHDFNAMSGLLIDTETLDEMAEKEGLPKLPYSFRAYFLNIWVEYVKERPYPTDVELIRYYMDH